MSKKCYYSISTMNPQTGRNDDLIATAQAAVNYLYKLCEYKDEKGRAVGTFPINKTLEEAGFTTSTAHFILFLNFMGLVRKLGKNGCKKGEPIYRYLVLDPTFFDLMVTEDTVLGVLKQMRERQDLQKENSNLKKKLDEMKSTASTVNNDFFDAQNENLAQVIAEVENLRDKNKALEAKMSEVSKPNPKVVAEKLMERFRKK